MADTVFDTYVSLTFFSKTLDPLVAKNVSKQVNNTDFDFLIVKLTYMPLPWQHDKYKQGFKIGFVYLQKIWSLDFLYNFHATSLQQYSQVNTTCILIIPNLTERSLIIPC